jgi:ParB family chromosome partitioning protein
MSELPIAAIKVGNRHRRDMGDIEGLAASIAEVGGVLLHPIVVRPDGTLIAGERRLKAVSRLGWTKVPVTVVDLDAVVRGELAENALRKDFTPSEMVAIAADVEEEERKLAKQRQVAALKRGSEKPVVENFHNGGKARDKVAAPLGISGRTLEKARAVVEAAQRDPDRFGPLVDEMDRTGK